MKRIAILLMVLIELVCFSISNAESQDIDLSVLSYDELLLLEQRINAECQSRSEWNEHSLVDKAFQLITEMGLDDLRQVQSFLIDQIVEKKQADVPEIHSDYTLSTIQVPADGISIRELFPDLNFAKIVRNTLGKPSVDSLITQDDLDRVTSLKINGDEGVVDSIEGISHFRNLKSLKIDQRALIWRLAQGPIDDAVAFTGDLPDEIGLLDKLEAFSATDFYFTYLPDSMQNLTNLKSLELVRGNIRELPNWIGEFKYLTTLRINQISITNIPDSIGNLSNLSELDLSITSLISLPDSLGALDTLRTLKLQRLDISELSDAISKLSSLQELDLSYSQIRVLPEDIGALSSLRVLDLTRTNISILPDSIGALSSLQTLELDYSQIKALPESISALKSLKTLNLKNTPIGNDGIPKSLFSMPGLSIDVTGTNVQ